MDPLATAEALANAAYDAWQDVRHRHDLHEVVGMGADGTTTSRADHLLEQAILEAAAAAGITVLSEEAGLVDHGSDLVAVVDPLDGSRNAERGIPFHCTSIAVGRGSLAGLEAGVVRSLVTGESYAARRGAGATVDGKAVQRRPSDLDDLMVGLIVDYSEMDLQRIRSDARFHFRDLGSSALELCLVGTGAMDIFRVQDDWLRVFDIAAATLFVREAGGVVLHPDTREQLDVLFDIGARTGLLAVHDESILGVVP